MKRIIKIFFITMFFSLVLISKVNAGDILTCVYDVTVDNEDRGSATIYIDDKFSARAKVSLDGVNYSFSVPSDELPATNYRNSTDTVACSNTETLYMEYRNAESFKICSIVRNCYPGISQDDQGNVTDIEGMWILTLNSDLTEDEGMFEYDEKANRDPSKLNYECTYEAGGNIPGYSSGYQILYKVVNGEPTFILGGNTSFSQIDPINITLTRSASFVVKSSCEDQGSLYVNANAFDAGGVDNPIKYIYSEPGNGHNNEIKLSTEESRFYNSDQVKEKNRGAQNRDNFSPQKLCEYGNCDIDVSNFCDETSVISVLRFIGILLFIAKVLVPLIIIGMGIYHLFMIITAGKPEEAKKQVNSIIKRVIVGVIIFLLPSFVYWIFQVAGASESGYSNCVNCILDLGNCSTK